MFELFLSKSISPDLVDRSTDDTDFELNVFDAEPTDAQVACEADVPRFTVAVVGEFSRGKSRLINRLLGQAVLSEGDVPTTAMLTRVMTGDRVKLVHVLPDRSQRELPLVRDSLERFLAAPDGRDPTGVLEIRIAHPWLKRNGIAFIDSPGVNGGLGQRAALASEAIAHCDATLIAVSAIAPLSLTEKTFIEEHICSRDVPRVAVVLTRLDQVAEEERENVVRFALDKLRSWQFPIEVWSAHGEPVLWTNLPLQAKGPEQILSALEHWVCEPDQQRRRHRQRQRFAQIAAQLLDPDGAQQRNGQSPAHEQRDPTSFGHPKRQQDQFWLNHEDEQDTFWLDDESQDDSFSLG